MPNLYHIVRLKEGWQVGWLGYWWWIAVVGQFRWIELLAFGQKRALQSSCPPLSPPWPSSLANETPFKTVLTTSPPPHWARFCKISRILLSLLAWLVGWVAGYGEAALSLRWSLFALQARRLLDFSTVLAKVTTLAISSISETFLLIFNWNDLVIFYL